MISLATFLLVYANAIVYAEERATHFGFSRYYQNHMVLQKGQGVVVWGTSSKPGDTVHVLLNGHEVAQTNVHNNGIWQATFTPPSKYGPHSITARSSLGNANLSDVWFGNVWVCSGQSNMEFPVSRLLNHTEEYTDAANYPQVRLFRLHHLAADTTHADVGKIDIDWTPPTTASLPYFSALCWLYGKQLSQHLQYPIGLVESNWGGTPIEAWSSATALAKCPAHTGKRAVLNSHTPTALYNGMIFPLLKNTIKGAIWYQGESNAGRASQYACQFSTMINDWRRKFHFSSNSTTSVNFPFGFVQLAPNRPGDQIVHGFTELRWSQTANMGYVPNSVMPNTFMAVAIDLPDFTSPFGSIHPRYKHDIARRLVLSSLAVAYHEAGFDYQGPFPSSFVVNGDNSKLTIEYDNGKTPIEIRTAHGFELFCSSQSNNTMWIASGWNNVTMVSHTDSTVVLGMDGCVPSFVRYAWRQSPCDLLKCAVYSRDSDLPAPPFIHKLPVHH